MKVSKFSTLTSTFFAVLVNQSIAEGLMNCTVKHQALHEMVEGQPKSYTGYANSFSVGDKLNFVYFANEDDELELQLDSIATQGIDFKWSFSNLAIFGLPDERYIVSIDDLTGLDFQEEKITINNISFNKLSLRRYYKNDYQGMLVGFNDFNRLSAHVVGLDCRTIKDGFQEIFETFE